MLFLAAMLNVFFLIKNSLWSFQTAERLSSYQRQHHCLDKMNAFDIKNNTLSAMYQLWGKKTVGGFKVSEEQLRE